jgi:hypothetical protein
MAIEAVGQTVSGLAKNHDKELPGSFGQNISSINPSHRNESASEALASLKEESNAALLQASLDVSISSGNQSLSLLLKTAIEGINESLEDTMGPNAIQNSYDSGIDVSPEATAERIVSMSTAFFSVYQEQHPEMSTEEALSTFVGIIGGGIDQGFSEAREILSGLRVLEGDIATNINKTYTFVQEGLAKFSASVGETE